MPCACASASKTRDISKPTASVPKSRAERTVAASRSRAEMTTEELNRTSNYVLSPRPITLRVSRVTHDSKPHGGKDGAPVVSSREPQARTGSTLTRGAQQMGFLAREAGLMVRYRVVV